MTKTPYPAQNTTPSKYSNCQNPTAEDTCTSFTVLRKTPKVLVSSTTVRGGFRTTTNKLAACLSRCCFEQGLSSTFATDNVLHLPCHIHLFTKLTRFCRRGEPFRLTTLGNLGLVLAETVALSLQTPCEIKTSAKQILYENCKLGVIPLEIYFPNNEVERVLYEEVYCQRIAQAVALFAKAQFNQ